MFKFLKKLLEIAGTVGMRLKYGYESDGVVGVVCTAIVSKAASGHFVALDASGKATICTSATTYIFGALEGVGEETLTAGEKRMCRVTPQGKYRIPVISGTMAQTLIGKTCDLIISGSIQGAHLNQSDRDTIKIVDGDIDNNAWVDVVIVPDLMDAGGVV